MTIPSYMKVPEFITTNAILRIHIFMQIYRYHPNATHPKNKDDKALLRDY